ncbi:MAG: GAF domain-containing protein [Anaerolineae bacterium]
MLTWLREQLTPPTFEDDERMRVARLLSRVIWTALIILVAVGPVVILVNQTSQDMWLSALLVGGFLAWHLALLALVRRGQVRVASVLFCSLLWFFVLVSSLIFGGIRGSIVPAYLPIIFMAGFLLGERGAVTFGLLSLLAIVGVFVAEYYFDAVLRPARPDVAWDNVFIIASIVIWMMVVVSLGWRNFAAALERVREHREALHARLEELRESRATIQRRTQELEQRTRKLQAAVQVGRETIALRTLDLLLERSVALLQEHFGLYHVALFLVDNAREYAVLRKAAGHAAAEVMAQGLRLRIGGGSLVSSVIMTREAMVTSNVEESPLYRENPLLDETRSEAVMPLRVRHNVIGVLDLQSREAEAFTEDTVAVLQLVADQLAVAIENARLLEEMQATVQELTAASGQFTREAWRRAVEGEGRARGYRYDRVAVAPLPQDGDELLPTEQTDDTLSVPLKLREQVIGKVNLRFADEQVSPEVAEFVEGVAERLVLSMENARLLEASRQRAARERLVREITAELRASADVEGVLRRTVRELGRALDARGTVRVVPDREVKEDAGKGAGDVESA